MSLNDDLNALSTTLGGYIGNLQKLLNGGATDLDALTTTDKTSVVNAVNEVSDVITANAGFFNRISTVGQSTALTRTGNHLLDLLSSTAGLVQFRFQSDNPIKRIISRDYAGNTELTIDMQPDQFGVLDSSGANIFEIVDGDMKVKSFAGKAYASHFGVDGTNDAADVLTWLEFCRDNDYEAILDVDAHLNSNVVVDLNGSEGTQQRIHISGNGIVSFEVDSAVGGIHFQGTGAARQHTVSMKDVNFVPGRTNSGYPFRVTGIEGGVRVSRAVNLENINIGPKSETSTFNFGDGIALTGIFRPRLSNVIMWQSIGCTIKWDTVLDLRGSYSPLLENGCFFNVQRAAGKADYGIRWGGVNAQGPEGFTSFGTIMNGADTGLIVEHIGREPHFQWLGGHINANDVCVRIDGLKYGVIKDALLYMTNDGTNGTYIQLVNVDGFELHNQFRHSIDEDYRILEAIPRVGGVVRNVKVTDFGLFGDNLSNAPYYIGAGCKNVELVLPNVTADDDFAQYPDTLVEVDSTATDVILRRGMSASAYNTEIITTNRSTNDSGYIATTAFAGTNSVGDYVDYTRRRDRIFDNTAGSESGFVDEMVLMEGVERAAVRFLRPPVADTSAMLLMIRGSGGTYTLKAVEQGAADSGGTGKRALIVDN